MKDSQTKKPKLTDAERHKRFVETAKKVEASDNVQDFDGAFDKLKIQSPSKAMRRRDISYRRSPSQDK
jgi:hypothetical protein